MSETGGGVDNDFSSLRVYPPNNSRQNGGFCSAHPDLRHRVTYQISVTLWHILILRVKSLFLRDFKYDAVNFKIRGIN